MAERIPSRQMKDTLHSFFLKQYEAYRDDVLQGRKPCGHLELGMVRRQESELQKDWKYVFDWDKATEPLVWIAYNLKFPDGPKRGQPMKLESWQVWVIMVCFGWVYKTTGTRRFGNAFIEVGRKNGKTSLMASVIAYLAFSRAEQTGSPCYCAATTLKQAKECFTRAAQEMKHNEEAGAQIFNAYNNAHMDWQGGTLIPLCSKPEDGKLPHGALIDEYHQHKDDDLLNSLASGDMADPNCMIIRITTAGTNLHGPCKQEHDRGVKVLEGSINIDSFFYAIYSPDKDDDVTQEDTWKKANPNYGVSIVPDKFKDRYDKCRNSVKDMIDFKTKNLNLWVNGLDRWADMSKWNELCNIRYDEEALKGRVCYGGLDLSYNSDITAFTLDFPYDNGLHRQKSWYFVPEERVRDLERQLYVSLSTWISEGYIHATPGPVVDYSYVASIIAKAREDYDLTMVAADRWHLEVLDQHMPQWWELLACEFSQGWKAMSQATSGFERAYKTGLIQANKNPVTTWMMSCAESKSDINGNVKIIKPEVRRSQARIDGVITSIMAFDTAQANQPNQMTSGMDVESMFSFF